MSNTLLITSQYNAVYSAEDINTVVNLADVIWHQHYTPIIGREQVLYMLDKFHTATAVNEQIHEQNFQYYLIQYQGNNVGYLAIQQRKQELFLSKIYLLSSMRGKGIGKQAMEFIKEQAKSLNCEAISLTVNKHNTDTIAAYKKIGFVKTGEAVFDIGNSFVMDDYLMSLSL
ncbi:GNAT family N-acetyltransferase [Thalassotalea crassostreae]|uniref:GNAT family N-acetyltransferase n=1 Tax=Thalassotalea crassostreae TaxID=1763536 RepID=UPI000837C4CE|nr:GNAT family N-acetyltransferase [Thalassotalea crassostreae]